MGLARLPRTSRAILFLLITVILCPPAFANVIYVDNDASGASDNTSWVDAYVYLQDALADANDSPKPVEIDMALGTYRPDQGTVPTC